MFDDIGGYVYIYIHVMRMAAQLCKVNSKVIRKTVENGCCLKQMKIKDIPALQMM